MFVERVEQSIAKPPQEEENRNESNRINGLAQRQLGGIGALLGGRLERARLYECLEAHDTRAAVNRTRDQVLPRTT